MDVYLSEEEAKAVLEKLEKEETGVIPDSKKEFLFDKVLITKNRKCYQKIFNIKEGDIIK